ncbi:DNA cytosine methyltransferase [Escherichia coli]
MNIQAVDIFVVRGLNFWAKKAGIEVSHGIDIDESCRFAIESNNPLTQFINQSVTELQSCDVSAMFKEGNIRLLAGCAPCQPFSKYRNPNSRKDDTKWRLLYEFQRLVSDVMPELVTMENVPQLRNHKVFEGFVSALKTLGYHLWYDVVRCSEYGLPQNRRRLILIGSQLGPISLDQKKLAVKLLLRMLLVGCQK